MVYLGHLNKLLCLKSSVRYLCIRCYSLWCQRS